MQQPIRHPLALFRDDTVHAAMKHQHLVLCPACEAALCAGNYCLNLEHVVDLEGEHAQNLADMSTREDDLGYAWPVGFDGCDVCGVPPHGQERTRRGPSELFAILYGKGDAKVNYEV